ncbi:hypothetical protein, partial [Herbaspirillum frisingense]|uniref:hypothetical protein n=2 Tax=Herbaspirillum frisingense TaxID=92645 RepID=UPI0039B10127
DCGLNMGQLWMQISWESGSVFNANQQAIDIGKKMQSRQTQSRTRRNAPAKVYKKPGSKKPAAQAAKKEGGTKGKGKWKSGTAKRPLATPQTSASAVASEKKLAGRPK